MKNYILAAVVAMLGLINTAHAEEVLFLSPTRILLNDTKKVAVINVTNLSDIQRTYTVTSENIVMTPEGTTTGKDNFEYSAKRHIRFVPREFTVNPGQRQAIRIMSRLPADTADGDYHCHIGFEEDVSKRKAPDVDGVIHKGQAGIAAPIAYSAMIPVVISHGKVTSKVTMGEPSVKKDPKKPGIYVITMKLTREGNGQGLGVFEFVYTQPDGKTVQLGKRSTAHIYRELKERTYSYDLKLPDGVPSGGTVRISLFNDYDSDKPLQSSSLKIPQ